MIFQVSTFLLLPLLIPQGIYVRKTVPRLPEADGPRKGLQGRGKKLSLWILGDSAAAGVGVEHQQQALSGQLTSQLQSCNTVNWELDAKTGVNSTELIEKLKAKNGACYDVVVLSIGVNDVTSFISPKSWARNIERIAEVLTTKFQAKQVLFSAVPQMHLFPALPQPLRWWVGLRAKKLDGLLRTTLIKHKHCTYVPITFPITSECIASDGFHPGQLAYNVWAKELAQQIQFKLS